LPRRNLLRKTSGRVRRKRRREEEVPRRRDDAVLADDAVLLAAADKFAGEEKKRALATVDENELIDAGARGVSWADDAVAASREARGALLANDDFAGGEAFFEREEAAGVRSVASDNGEDTDVFVSDWIEQTPVAIALGGSGAGEGLAETRPRTPSEEMPMRLPSKAERTERSMRSLQRRRSVDRTGVRLGGRTRQQRNLAWKRVTPRTDIGTKHVWLTITGHPLPCFL